MPGGRLDNISTPPSLVAPRLPLAVVLLRWIAVVYLAIFKRFSVIHAQRLPRAGPVIVVSNHVKAYDPVCIQVASKHRLIRFLQAREYYEARPVHYLLKLLQVIPLNRTGNDTAGIRTALRALAQNACIGIFPEGKISEDGDLHEARQGVALLALATNAVVIPSYIHSTHPFAGMLRDYLEFSRVTLYFGEPVPLDDLYGKHRDPEVREAAIRRIMAAIVALRDGNLRHPPRHINGQPPATPSALVKGGP